MDEKFKKHYLQVVKTVTEQGEDIKELKRLVTELKVIIAKLKNDDLTKDMSAEDKDQFNRTFNSQPEDKK